MRCMVTFLSRVLVYGICRLSVETTHTIDTHDVSHALCGTVVDGIVTLSVSVSVCVLLLLDVYKH